MKNVIIKDGKIYSESFGKVDVFEIVDKIPTGFFVWNIGDNMGHDEYIPVCQDLRPGDKDSFEINARTLKAIKLSMEEVQLLRKAAGYGVNSKETAENIHILYGGSCNAGNAKELFSMPNIDGGLIGGAGLKPEFIDIVHCKEN